MYIVLEYSKLSIILFMFTLNCKNTRIKIFSFHFELV